jgi:hypothetical protein
MATPKATFSRSDAVQGRCALPGIDQADDSDLIDDLFPAPDAAHDLGGANAGKRRHEARQRRAGVLGVGEAQCLRPGRVGTCPRSSRLVL